MKWRIVDDMDGRIDHVKWTRIYHLVWCGGYMGWSGGWIMWCGGCGGEDRSCGVDNME